MSFKQDDKTKKFIKQVKMLLDKGEVKNYEAIRAKLDWDKTLLSNVMNGRKNVPADIYRKFTEVYPYEQQDARDELIALLREQNEYLKSQIEDFKKRFTAIEQSLTQARRDQLMIASVQQAYQSWWIENFAPKGKTPDQVFEIIGRKSLEALKKLDKEGISVG